MEITGETLDVLLDALAEQLGSLGVQLEIVVIGGSALTALGLVKRATRDVDLVVTRRYGQVLAVHFAGRVDQIHFKLFAMVDQAGGRHETDLRALHPTREELVAAARWSMTQDPSPGYRMVLLDALSTLGVEDADLGA